VIVVTRAIFISFVLVFPAVAAPPPAEPEAAKLKRLWGVTSDPDKDCTFTLAGDSLTIVIPGSPHLFKSLTVNAANAAGILPKDNFPSVVSAAEGDFTAVLKLGAAGLARGVENKNAIAAAGLFVTAGECRMSVAVAHWLDETGNPKQSKARFCLRDRVGAVATGYQPLAKDGSDVPKYLRLTRVGGKVAGAMSADGEKWEHVGNNNLIMATAVSVGVFAEADAGRRYEVTFDSLTVTPAGK
jgi:hypothetical protein